MDGRKPPRIGITANFMHADADRPFYRHKTLHYFEERMALSLSRAGGDVVGIVDVKQPNALRRVIDGLDGVVIAGGADVAPQSYGDTPQRPEWSGDAKRDAFELAVVRHALDRAIPVFGICRGLQLLNVAMGGTLWQDLTQLRPEQTLTHRDWHRYDTLGHAIRLDPDGFVGRCYGNNGTGATTLEVNSIHHQGIRNLAPGLRAVAWASDGVIEAVQGMDTNACVQAVQWHPEWLEPERSAQGGDAPGWSNGLVILEAFIERCRAPM